MKANKLKLNAEKTNLLTVGTAQRLRNVQRPIRVLMDNVTLSEDPSKSEKLHGCQVSSDMKWEKQTNYLLSKLKLRLNGL